MDDPKRNRNYNTGDGYASPRCDATGIYVTEGDWKGGDSWYRFQEPAGIQLADSIVPKMHCGGHATGWLNGAHPAVLGEHVIRQVCFNWDGNSCNWELTYNVTTDVEIMNCGGYYLYKFKAVVGCNLKYCGQ